MDRLQRRKSNQARSDMRGSRLRGRVPRRRAGEFRAGVRLLFVASGNPVGFGRRTGEGGEDMESHGLVITLLNVIHYFVSWLG